MYNLVYSFFRRDRCFFVTPADFWLHRIADALRIAFSCKSRRYERADSVLLIIPAAFRLPPEIFVSTSPPFLFFKVRTNPFPSTAPSTPTVFLFTYPLCLYVL